MPLYSQFPAGTASTPVTYSSSGANWNTSLSTLTWSTGASGAVSVNSSGTLTLFKDGYYVIVVTAAVGSGSSGAVGHLNLIVNGSEVDETDVSDTVDSTTRCRAVYTGVVTGARTVSVTGTRNAAMPTPTITIVFVPTPTYPQ